MPYEMLIDGGGNGIADLDVYWIFAGVQENTTSAEIQVYVGNTASVGSYGYELQLKGFPFTGIYITASITQTTSEFVKFNITSLTPGTTYTLKVRAYSGANRTGTYGLTKYTEFTVPKAVSYASILETFHRKEREGLEIDLNTGTIYDTLTGTTSSVNSSSGSTINNNTGGSLSGITSSGSTNENINVVDELTKKIGAQQALLASIVPLGIEKTTKSLFKLSNNTTNPDDYTVAYKSYGNLLAGKTYYVFGTSMFFKANNTNPNQSGGIAFFVDNAGQTGYFIQVSTTANSATTNSKEFKILKIKNGNMTKLDDSQTIFAKSLGGIYGGKTYKIDVRVKVNATSVEIYCYINGIKIYALDANPIGNASVVNPTTKLNETNRVAMICNAGTVYFDYIYGLYITQKQFEQEELFNIYDGQYSNATLSFLHGNKILENNALSATITNGFVEEFGSVARELRVIKTKYGDNKPAFPLYASTGINPFAKILGQRLSSFAAEVYVLNNAGTYIPLDDSEYYSFYILGKFISPSGTLEYTDTTQSDYTNKEPITFESKWIQKQSDVENLANWIKSTWSTKQRIINIEVFGNPLLSIGDIITVTYPYNNLTTSSKFVITNIRHRFEEGLSTSITARTL